MVPGPERVRPLKRHPDQFSRLCRAHVDVQTGGQTESVNVSLNRPRDRTWRRPPGRLRNNWLDQLRNDSTRLIGDLWRRAVDRGHGGATTRRPSPATRP